MTRYTRPMLRFARNVIGETVASTSPSAVSSLDSSDYGENFNCTITASTGNIWINPIGTATTNSFKLHEGDVIDLTVKNRLSVVSNSSDAKFQGFIWEV